MATTSFYRIAATVAALAAAPCAARQAVAQAAIHVGAVVTAPAGLVSLRPDSVTLPPPSPEVARLRIPGVGGLDVQAGPGSAVRFAPQAAQPRAAETPSGQPSPRTVRVTIDYVGS